MFLKKMQTNSGSALLKFAKNSCELWQFSATILKFIASNQKLWLSFVTAHSNGFRKQKQVCKQQTSTFGFCFEQYFSKCYALRFVFRENKIFEENNNVF